MAHIYAKSAGVNALVAKFPKGVNVQHSVHGGFEIMHAKVGGLRELAVWWASFYKDELVPAIQAEEAAAAQAKAAEAEQKDRSAKAQLEALMAQVPATPAFKGIQDAINAAALEAGLPAIPHPAEARKPAPRLPTEAELDAAIRLAEAKEAADIAAGLIDSVNKT